MSRTRKVHVKSFGCQMNVYDFHRMADTLAPAGFSETAHADDADLVILNTCNIREKAVDKVYSEIGRVREIKEAAAARRPPHADRGGRLRRAGRGQGDHPPRQRGRSGGRLAELSPPARPDRARASGRTNRRYRISSRRQIRRAGRATAAKPSPSAASPLLSPCRKAATNSAHSAWCPIRAAPKFRARSRRLPPKSNAWREAGVREVTLIGQNVNAYHGARHRRRAGVAWATAAPAQRRARHCCGCAT